MEVEKGEKDIEGDKKGEREVHLVESKRVRKIIRGKDVRNDWKWEGNREKGRKEEEMKVRKKGWKEENKGRRERGREGRKNGRGKQNKSRNKTYFKNLHWEIFIAK